MRSAPSLRRIAALAALALALASGVALGAAATKWRIDVNANGKRLYGLPAPTVASDATTKTYVDTAVSGAGATPGWFADARTACHALAGFSAAGRVEEKFFTFGDTVGLHSAAGGTGFLTPDGPGGAFLFSTGATANSWQDLYSGASAGTIPTLVGTAATTKYCVRVRFQMTTAIDAQARVIAGLCAGESCAAGVMAGIRGATSTAKFMLYGGTVNTTILSTVNIDTALHNLMVVADGALWHLSVDSEAYQTGTQRAFAAGVNPAFQAVNGTTAANRAVKFYAAAYFYEVD